MIERVLRARSVRALTLAFALACSTSTAARAQEPPPPEPRAVLLTVPDCLGAPGQAVKDLVALELAPRMRVVDASAGPVLSGSVRCTEDAPLVLLTVADPARAEPLHVELDLAAAAPLARARLLALTLAELITTSQLEQPPPSFAPPAPPSEAGVQPEPDQSAGARSSSALQLWLAPALSIAGAPATALLGADLGAAYALGPVLVVLDVEVRFGQSDRTASEVSLRAFSAGAALMPLWIDGRGAQLSAGAGFRIGHIAMTGSSSRDAIAADQLSGVWLGPALLGALRLPLAGPSALRFALEGGYVARPVVGLDERGAERMVLRGPWLSASVGFALELL